MPRVELRGRELWAPVPEEIARALGINEGDALSFEMLDKELAGLRKANAIAKDEMDVLRKLNEIRFSERTKERVARTLADAEQRVLGKLVKRGAVRFYEEDKYKGRGVYSIAKDYYTYLAVAQDKPAGNTAGKALGGQKYLVVDNIERANDLLGQLESEVKEGSVVSVRGFDGKVYITTRDVVEALGGKVAASLEKGELPLARIAAACGEEEGLVRTVVEILRESGELIEKRQGNYALA